MSEARDFELNAKNRIILLNVLPAQGDITTLRLVLELRKSLSFTEQEHKDLGIKSTGTATTWDLTNDVAKSFPIGPVMLKLIQRELKKLDDGKTLGIEQVDIYNLFMDPTKE